MTLPAGDGSRDRRIEDPSNLYLIHPAARALLPLAVRRGISANTVSLIGLAFGAAAALGYARWREPGFAVLGLLCSIAWLICDGLDGMVARATRTASALGRILDGLCDHGVFILIYVALALSIGTAQGWALAIVAGACHAVQSSLYEGERARFHRRTRGVALGQAAAPSGNRLVRFYDGVAGSIDRLAMPFERRLAGVADPQRFGQRYADRAAPAMRLQYLLTANMRVLAIFLACQIGDPRLFWWYEIGPMSAILALGLVLHRGAERRVLRPGAAPSIFLSSEQGHS